MPLEIALNVPDLWQQNAVRVLQAGGDVLIDAPTGAGKTRVFELHVESGGATRRGQAVYTVPTRALANDKYTEWQSRGWNVGIATGDLAENLRAPVIVATLETQRERLLGGDPPGFLVIDEYQMLADPRRGLNYELALALAPTRTQLLLLSGSVRNPEAIAGWLERLGRHPEIIRVAERPVPLNEIPIENLPRVPDSVSGFWARLAAAAHRAQLTPLLIFAPRRADAEKIARKAAEGLPPEEPIPISPEDESLLGRDLTRLIARRAAFHHSGLAYAARAGWIEPLARNGHLHVITATTGLAAGINFSVRSVFIAGTTYADGPFQRELRADELLQMFGRAGRRGLDSEGTILVARDSPRLFDAAQRQIRRVNEIDWPSLLRVMESAGARGEAPLEAARAACANLFSPQPPSLGLEPVDRDDSRGGTNSSGNRAPQYIPTREEFLDSTGEWQPARDATTAQRPLSECLAHHHDKWQPALRVAAVVEKIGPGRLCRLNAKGTELRYGKELTVAHRAPDDRLAPLPWVRKQLHLTKAETFSEADFLTAAAPLLIERDPTNSNSNSNLNSNSTSPRPVDLVPRGSTVALRLDIASVRRNATIDSHGAALLDPPRRRVTLGTEVHLAVPEHEAPFNPPPGTAAHAWRQLGLIDATGNPTPRGRVFSRFQAGEGLVIAAALEDSRYPVEEIVQHLANLRGGHRFADLATGASDQLAAATRAAYGHVDHPGYLETGLNPGYGDGTAEALETYRSGGIRAIPRDLLIHRGDFERAHLEWLSLLRHIAHAPDPRAPRFAELQDAARTMLASLDRPTKRESRLPAQFRQRRATRESFFTKSV